MKIGFSKVTVDDGTAEAPPGGSKVQPVKDTRQKLAASRRHIDVRPDEERL
jgi:hypothetical protein